MGLYNSGELFTPNSIIFHQFVQLKMFNFLHQVFCLPGSPQVSRYVQLKVGQSVLYTPMGSPRSFCHRINLPGSPQEHSVNIVFSYYNILCWDLPGVFLYKSCLMGSPQAYPYILRGKFVGQVVFCYPDCPGQFYGIYIYLLCRDLHRVLGVF